MAIRIPYKYLTFTDKVQRCYKRSLRNLEDWVHERSDFRLQAVMMRVNFEKMLNCPDPVKANLMLEETEKELFKNTHWQPRKFPKSPAGTAYQRVIPIPDWVLDYWHPLEKAQYPEYFARRELRKQEYIEWWDKTYGNPTKEDQHH